MTLVNVTFCPFDNVVVISVVILAGTELFWEPVLELGGDVGKLAGTKMDVVKVDVESVVVTDPALFVIEMTMPVPDWVPTSVLLEAGLEGGV